MINIEKSKAPELPFKYNDIDIKDKIRNDFFVLCYICEEHVPVHFEIDHFYPQKHYPELKNNWDNLFFSCPKCNQMRYKDINTHNGNEVLNNCNEDVENIIKLKYIEDTHKIEIKSDENTDKIKYTIKLLNKIYNGIETPIKAPRYRRDEIKQEIDDFKKLLEKYDESNDFFENSIKLRLSKKTKTKNSNYVSFKRQVIKNNAKYHQFKKYFD